MHVAQRNHKGPLKREGKGSELKWRQRDNGREKAMWWQGHEQEECRQPLETEKDKETYSSLEPPEGAIPVDNLIVVLYD